MAGVSQEFAWQNPGKNHGLGAKSGLVKDFFGNPHFSCMSDGGLGV
jgi:hypothetical protein